MNEKKRIQHELNAGLRWCKDAYRKKLEAKFQEFEGCYSSVLIALLSVCDGASGENKVCLYIILKSFSFLALICYT